MRRPIVPTLLLGLLLAGCLPKHQGTQAPSKLDVAVVAAVDYVDQPEVTGVPDALAEAIVATLEARNLVPEMAPASGFAETFAGKRNTLHRLTWLAREDRGSDLVLLVEARARYFSLLSGRYRWTVDLSMTLTSPGNLDEAVTTEAKFPIFMEFHHEREEEVLEAAVPMIERHLGFLLDEFLGGLAE